MQRPNSIWILFIVLLVVQPSAGAESGRAGPPNVILILVDDLGWRDWSGAGNEIVQTPAIDQLAKQGMRFTRAYAACAVCSPTRAAVQTGRYPARVGVTDWIRSRFQRPGGKTPISNPTEYVGGPQRRLLCPPNPYWMESNEITLAELLRDAADYRTAYIGKWHLGDDNWYPEQQGFEVNLGGCDYGQPPNYFDPFNQPGGRHVSLREGIYNLPSRQPGQYLTDRETDEACHLIESWKNERFIIQLSNYAVHTPLQAPEADIARYRRDGVTKQQATYAAMVESVDRAVKRIQMALKQHGLEENTILWFTSDNGGLDSGGNPTENLPLREGKGHPYEGGIRVPNLVQWASHIPPNSHSDVPMCSIDILPTICDYCGVELPQDVEVDGVSLAEHLNSGGQDSVADRALLWHFPHYRGKIGPYSIIQRDSWKLLHYYEGRTELYHLAEDPGESRDLAHEHPRRVASLRAELVSALEKLGAKLPRENPDFRQP